MSHAVDATVLWVGREDGKGSLCPKYHATPTPIVPRLVGGSVSGKISGKRHLAAAAPREDNA